MKEEHYDATNVTIRGLRAWLCRSRMLRRIAGPAAVLTLSLSFAACQGGESASQEQEPQNPPPPASTVTPPASTTAQTQQQTSPTGYQQQTGQTGTTESQQPAPAAADRGGRDTKDKDDRTLPIDLVHFVPEGVCTKRKCPPDRPCCNTCRFKRWRPAKGEPLLLKGSTSETKNIPRCKMNGCGRCAFHLLANGVVSGKKFMAFSIRKANPDKIKKKEPVE